MSKRSRIRWTSSDEQELRRVVKNFNAKISRSAKKNPDNAGSLPERVSVAELREMIETRADFNRELNALRRFSRRGAEELVVAPQNKNNVKITKWQRDEQSRRAGIVNRKRKQKHKELFEIPQERHGEPLGYTLGQIGMGRVDEHTLRPTAPFAPSMGRADVMMRYKQLVKESFDSYWSDKERILVENYIKSLTDNFSKNEIKDIVDKIRSMSFKDFRTIFEKHGGHALFEFSYPLTDEEKSAFISELKSIWAPNKDPSKKSNKKKKGGK